ncbi:unnamed protein product [Moneuplotes crassus]|uniref:Uncharacterized protein n=1 Tax=Euplotes crassus TaxID=5936 RepID=A0AAD1U2T6_EUPCR|nr:unnamed protein product [Moneuplotes crassus]
MPRKKMSPEELEKAFNDFNGSEEWALWYNLSTKIISPKDHDIEELERGTVDISGNWQPFLDDWFSLVCKLKVPHKSKKYDQFYIRTMFFPRQEAIHIDGIKYEIPNHVRVDTFNSKEMIIDGVFEELKSLEEMEKENYLETKKKLIAKLKEFDKQYVKHIKKTHPEVQAIITPAIEPLLNLLESNYNFHKLEELMKTQHDIPKFRVTALEEKFCEHMEIICKILSDHGKLQDIYDIKRMLNLLKLDDWENIVPMAFYLAPLKKSIHEMREELLHMRSLGANRCKYHVEDNEPFHQLVIKMVKNDVTAQWLMGDRLKNDQLCFLYEVIKIIFQSNLKNKLINKDKNLIENVIPSLACFKGLLVIRNIRIKQIEEAKKEKKRAEHGLPPTDEEEKIGDPEENKVNEDLDVEDEEDEEQKEYREFKKQKEKEEAEHKKYGRKWIWQNYISENRKDDWLNVAEDLRHINDHVIQDIQDFILISAFPKEKQTKRTELAKDVEGLLLESEEVKAKEDPEEIKKVKETRDFELSLRPPYIWNFKETRMDVEEKIKADDPLKTQEEIEKERLEEEAKKEVAPYLINPNALPESCYKYEEDIHTNRVTKLLKDLENLTYNLRNHEQQKWKTLTDLCIDIFIKK